MGKFQKGISGNPKGKPAGAVARRTQIVQSFAEAILAKNIPDFTRELRALKGKAKVDAVLALMEYCVPKKSRVEVSNDGETVKITQVFKIGDKEITL